MFKTLNKKILTTTLALFMTIPAFASVAVSPTRIEINANKVKNNYITTAIEVKGDSQQPMRFKVYPKFFTINNKNEMVLVENSTAANDLTKKTRFVPSEFTVAQGKSQKLRVNITGINQLPDGENRVVLFIEDINPKEFNIPTGMQGIGAQLIVKTRVGVPIYLDKGKVVKEAEMEYFNLKQENGALYTDMKLVSKGNSKVRYSGIVQIVQGKKLIDEYNINEKVVPSNGFYIDKQKVKTDKLNTPGEYTLRMIISYIDGNGKRVNIKKETNFNTKGNV